MGTDRTVPSCWLPSVRGAGEETARRSAATPFQEQYRREVRAAEPDAPETSNAIGAGDHTAVLSRMTDLVANDSLRFLMDLSIDPVHAALTATEPSGGA